MKGWTWRDWDAGDSGWHRINIGIRYNMTLQYVCKYETMILDTTWHFNVRVNTRYLSVSRSCVITGALLLAADLMDCWMIASMQWTWLHDCLYCLQQVISVTNIFYTCFFFPNRFSFLSGRVCHLQQKIYLLVWDWHSIFRLLWFGISLQLAMIFTENGRLVEW